MHVILVHGLGRTPVSLLPLAWRLRRRGYRTHTLAYGAWREPFDSIVARLVALVQSQTGGAPYLLVGHSLGAIMARAALPALAATPPRHLVQLAPPNQPPRMAWRLRQQWLYQAFTQDCGRCLASPAFYRQLPIPQVPTTVIAGTAGPRGRWSPFGMEPNDGVVAVAETALPGATVLLVPAIHTLIMNDRVVVDVVDRAAAG